MTTYKFSDKVIARNCMYFTRRDGRQVCVYPQQRGKVVTPVEYADAKHTGLMLVEWTGLGWFWCKLGDVERVEGVGK